MNHIHRDQSPEDSSFSPMPLVPQGGDDRYWDPRAMAVDEPRRVPVLVHNPYTGSETKVAATSQQGRPYQSEKGGQAQVRPQRQQYRQQQHGGRRLAPAERQHPYAHPGQNGSMTVGSNSSMVAATKNATATRGTGGVIQMGKSFKTDAEDKGNPTFLHPGGIRMKTIQFAGSIHDYWKKSSLSSSDSMGKTVLMEVIGTKNRLVLSICLLRRY